MSPRPAREARKGGAGARAAPAGGPWRTPPAGTRTCGPGSCERPHTAAGQSRNRTGFPCVDSRSEHTCCGVSLM
ncbi:hypothetical protein VM98_26040 [Streptomyces rubellomurinus subsp. indigoferus]|uniref:Uncharacterized protein n=1 Tax=Streptomyces rubellomurinus (strain ATCC 31215) TaxID=359131 RepID=A0A0F2TAE4_STRR3|nr:hypothetical protein VM98_26040 [Streptomyces rubellomurinus subsp. indigoferus]KJS60168.1 hypothetical protein VM95_22690 [Streptomyces rubellomurinus]